jgi:hypothetical protein
VIKTKLHEKEGYYSTNSRTKKEPNASGRKTLGFATKQKISRSKVL